MAIINSLGSQELSYLSGLSASQGYQVLNKTMAQSVTNFEKTPQAQSDITYFEQNIGKEKTVSDFLSNTRLVDFVLSAYGLDAEDNYQGLIKAVLTQDPNASGSLVNQLSDPRFKQMASALDFFDDGLGQLQAVGLGDPTSATVAEGITFASTTAPKISAAPSQPAIVTTQSVDANIPLKIGVTTSGNQYFQVQEPAGTSNTIGIGFSDNEYLQVQEPDGSTGYTQSGSFALNSAGQLALADGSVLQPATTFPTGTTSVNVTSGGQLEAYVNGSTTATVVGQLQTAIFTDDTQLTQDANGYYTPTSGSGAATVADSTGTVSTAGAVAYTQSGYFTINGEGQLAASDGSILLPNISVPSDTTSVNITSDGVIEANELGSKTPTVLAQLQTASFTDPSSLSQDALGYYTANSASGSANVGDPTAAISTYDITSNLQTTVTQSVASSSGSGVSVGLGINGSDYLVLQKADGTQTYAKSGYFTVNSNNQLTLPDGSQLVPSPVIPTGTTGVTITSSGALYAEVKGKSTPISIGQLETARFANPSQLSEDKNGYYTPTAASGSAVVGFQSGKSFAFNNSLQGLVNNYVQNEFEIAVGDENTGVREALYFQRSIGSDEAAYSTYNLATKADVILGDSVLSNVAETVLDQPAQIAYQSISSQEHIIESGIQISQLQNTKYVASLTARYLSMYDASNAAATETSNSPALQILSAFTSDSGSSSSSSSDSGSSLLSLLT